MRSIPAGADAPASPPAPDGVRADAGARARLERRRHVGTAADEALALYRTIFQNSTEAIAIIEPDGRYLEQNAAHQRLIGYTDDELRGQTPSIHLGAGFDAIAAELLESGVCRRECECRTKDGRTLTIELSAFAVRSAAGEPLCYVGVKRDVSEERRAAAELRQKLDELQAIYRMSGAVARAADLDDIYAVALDELQRTVQADRASVLLFDDDGVMRFRAWRGLSAEYRRAVEGHSPWSIDDPDPHPVLVADVIEDAALTPLIPVLAREGIRAVGFIPLAYGGQLLGKFMIYFDEPHEVQPAELHLAQTIASHIAVAITRKRSETALHDSEDRYRRLIEQSPVAVAVYCDGRVAFVNSAAVRLLGARDAAEIVGHDPMELVHPDSRAVAQGRFEQLARGAHTLPPVHERLVRRDGTPVDVELSTIGFTFEGRPAVQVVAIDVTERRRVEASQRLLAEAGALLASSLDYAETLSSITRLVVPEIADLCFVDLLEDDGGYTRIAAAAADESERPTAERMRRRYPAGTTKRGVVGVAHTGRTELATTVDDALLVEIARDAEHLATMRTIALTSYICAPLVARGRAIGVLTLCVGSSGRSYTEADVPLAEELASRAGLAVDNARLYREAQDASRAKSQFLTTMSHELRTPLNAIAGYVELLQLGLRGPVNEQQRADLARIQRSQKHLLGLITDLLSFARIEGGHLELDIERIPVEEALDGVEALLEPQIGAKGLRFERRRGAADVACIADRDRVRQVLVNLLSNAVKFTPSGGAIAVEFEATATEVRIHVRDTGPGIPASMLAAIFEPFVQIRDAVTRMTEGTGLGLAISRELARAMGGEVTVASTVDVGSTFTLLLPRST